MSVNKVIIVGRCGKDPEVRYMSDGGAVVNLSVATSEKYKDKSGQMVENTEWHRIVMYGKVAEISGQYVKKGTMAYFEGKLKTRKWQDQSGQDKYTTEIVCDRMQLLGGKSDESSGNERKSTATATATASNAVSQIDDDIPW